MKKQVSRCLFFLLLSCFELTVSVCFSQSIEEVYGLRLQETSCFQQVSSYFPSIDSTQVTDDGSHPLRLQYDNVMTGRNGITDVRSRHCRLLFSRTIVLPSNAEKKERCTVALNCKSEIDLLRFIVIARDKEENVLYIDSVVIPVTDKWADYSHSFCKPEARTLSIVIFNEGCNEANQLRSIYLDKISIRLGDQDFNNFPITSLVKKKDMRLKKKAILPLSFQNDASLKSIPDWKDKKIIALGESIDGIEDLMEVQIQLMKHLITWGNCRLIMMDMPQIQCLRWNLYLQGKRTSSHEEKLVSELTSSVYSPTVFLEFLQWLREYNAKASDPVRIVGISGTGSIVDYSCMADYLLEFSTTRQDSVYYLEALERGGTKLPGLKEYIEQSQLSRTLNKKDFQYLLFLIEEMYEIYKRPYRFTYTYFEHIPDNSFDEVQRIGKAVDIYLSPAQKAVFIARSVRVSKHFPIHDMEVKETRRRNPYSWEMNTDSLGHCLYKRYGKQYHAVSIQVGERSCLKDSSWYSSFSYPVEQMPLFPFSFEQAAMDSEVPYFYYPSDQLPDAILGLNLFAKEALKCVNPFCSCYIPLHFDGLVFIREVKAIRNKNVTLRYSFESDIIDETREINKLLKEKKE